MLINLRSGGGWKVKPEIIQSMFLILAVVILLVLPSACSNAGGNTAPSISPAGTPTSTPAQATVTTPPSSTPPGQATPTGAPLIALTPDSYRVERVFAGLDFEDLTNLVQTGQFIYVTEQSGIISAFNPDQAQTATSFLDITDRVNRGGSEEGLLGLAFDPAYEQNGYFYLYYSRDNPRRSVLSRFSRIQDNPSAAGPQSEVVILEIPQPFANHNGGQLAFGPDGFLYIGVGDGGSAGDPQGNGQSLGTLLGKILRIDVNGLSAPGSYTIPPDNPFVDTAGARAEIWAYGLRNPWRFSFDNTTGLLWCADVGQNRWEEINIISRGGNYGWNRMEGSHCYSPPAGCDQTGLVLPVAEYDHSLGCSITGGYVYRGGTIPDLTGYYIYGDYCSGNIWALGYQNNAVTANVLLTESDLRITSFGVDAEGEIYVLSNEGIYVLTASP